MVNKTNNKEEDARAYTDGLVEKALKAEQEAKQEQTNQTNRGIEDEGR